MRAHRPRRNAGFAGSVLAAALSAIAASPLSAAIINVGSGTGCETGSFEQAVAIAALSPEADEIRFSLAGGSTYPVANPISMNNFGPGGGGSLTVSGGWSSCTDTVPSQAEIRLSFQGAAGPFLLIGSSGGGTSNVTFRSVAVTATPAAGERLGIRLSGSGTTLTLDRSEIHLFRDGGVEVSGGADLLVDEDSSIHDNGPRPDGGGIHCTGAGSRVVLEGSVRSNQATRGGGIFAASGCEVELGSTSVIELNYAAVGGGIGAISGAQVSSEAGAAIDSNEAASTGGGIYAEGSATLVELASARLRYNRAGFSGGAIYATAGATVAMERAACPVAVNNCLSQLTSNELLPGGQQGAAATAAAGALLDLRQTFVTANTIDAYEDDGSVLWATGAGSEMRAESVVLARNHGPRRVVRADSGGAVRLAFTTVAYNKYEVYFGSIDAYGLRAEDSGSAAHVFSSIFFPSSGFQIAPEVEDTIFDCAIVQSTLGLPEAATHVTLTAPLYVSSTNLELREASPAVDYCGTAAAVPTGPDILGRNRGHDVGTNPNGNPGVPSGTSIQDIGAYELWELFADGFETGNSSRWSDQVP